MYNFLSSMRLNNLIKIVGEFIASSVFYIKVEVFFFIREVSLERFSFYWAYYYWRETFLKADISQNEPSSFTLPSSMNHIRSAFSIVFILWAMQITVMLTPSVSTFFIVSCMIFSDFLSRAEVASSKMSNYGFRMSARAMAMRCFCPPESFDPPNPISKSRF